ncbi:MAG: 4-hydroxy-tetrahydrodipicolinate synthase [Alphaproteobacteria bacterium 64-11]|nr:4-hydroxy-tetrahydrodipicolinate synthase [Alphaproteobacteria bacterium]OJU10617.1 MAG: 4-hydroxy-tetrahydrodipicolinate synthase [Alphaproteobacteria bacterium 64-11]
MTAASDRIKGSITALITPMKDDKVDETAFRKLVSWQIGEGTHGLVPCGTTGESPTLSHTEHRRVIEICIEQAAGRVPVIAGAGSNSTEEAISLTRFAKEAGADAVLSVTGYYNKPSQEGMYRHFMAIADAVDIPIILYNIPGRAIVEIGVETMARLSSHPNIIGVKDATANLMRPSRERVEIGTMRNDWLLLSGEDGTALGYMAHGGHGCISVTANVAPGLCARFQDACMAGDFAAALKIQDQLMPLHDAMFCEPSPAPVKYAASLLGLCQADVRLPLVEATSPARERIRNAMAGAGLKI